MLHLFDSIGYAKEDLRAKIACFLVGDQPGVRHDQLAAYVQVLKEDPKKILRASEHRLCSGLREGAGATNIEKLPQIARPGLRM